MYVKTQNGQVKTFPYDTAMLLRDNPNTSFPSPVPDRILAEYGVYPVSNAAQPDYDPITHTAKPSAPELVNGTWMQAWAVEARTDADVRVRSERNRLLSQTDYMALSDNTLTAEWAAYRQALRDIPQQAGFPSNVVWPNKPE